LVAIGTVIFYALLALHLNRSKVYLTPRMFYPFVSELGSKRECRKENEVKNGRMTDEPLIPNGL
jgi:hypothetical protein